MSTRPSKALDALANAAKEVGRSFSGSWMGYHSRVYYEGFRVPPQGAHFDQEWGLMETMGRHGSRGAWVEMDGIEVKAHIRKMAGEPNIDAVLDASRRARETYEEMKSEIVSILLQETKRDDDAFLGKLLTQLEEGEPPTVLDIANSWHSKGKILMRDVRAANAGSQLPPHIAIEAEVGSIRASFELCKFGAAQARKAASHVARKTGEPRREAQSPAEPELTVIPAADRVVRIDHNSLEYTTAISELDRLRDQLRGWNEYPDSEDKEQRLAELQSTKDLLGAVRVRADAIRAVAFGVLSYIGKKFADVAIGAIALGLLALIGRMTGLW